MDHDSPTHGHMNTPMKERERVDGKCSLNIVQQYQQQQQYKNCDNKKTDRIIMIQLIELNSINHHLETNIKFLY